MKRAMILAAGRGERMGELTSMTPKPLLLVNGHYLIEYSIFRIKQAGIRDIVINVSYRADQVKSALGDGSQYGVKLYYSEEPERLETGGGIFQALPLLGSEPFIVVSSDVITDFPLAQLPVYPEGLAHLIMVQNPPYHPRGDFALADGKVNMQGPMLTFGNVGVYRKELFAHCQPGYFRLTAVLNPAISANKVTGEQYKGIWYNIGTPTDLAEVNQRVLEKTYF